MISTLEAATIAGVPYSTMMLWLKQGRIKGAQLKDNPRGPIWEVPIDSVENLTRPPRGRPKKVFIPTHISETSQPKRKDQGSHKRKR